VFKESLATEHRVFKDSKASKESLETALKVFKASKVCRDYKELLVSRVSKVCRV
jgi:hypothetical protein